MKRVLLVAALTVGIIAGPAWAQQFKISEEQARKIAADRGIAQITEIERDDGNWEIEGRDSAGKKIELDVHGQTGEIVKFERD